MAWWIFRIPSTVVYVVCEIEEFLVFMRRYGQTSLEKYLGMEKLIDIVLNVWNALEDEVGAYVGQDKGNAKDKYDEIQRTDSVKYIAYGSPDSKTK